MKKDDITKAITNALASLDGPTGKGAFACKDKLSSDTLALSIDGFGDLRLPIALTRAKALPGSLPLHHSGWAVQP